MEDRCAAGLSSRTRARCMARRRTAVRCVARPGEACPRNRWTVCICDRVSQRDGFGESLASFRSRLDDFAEPVRFRRCQYAAAFAGVLLWRSVRLRSRSLDEDGIELEEAALAAAVARH